MRGAVARLDPKKYAPGLEVAYAGHVTSNILEHDALAEDLVWATLLVMLAVAAAVAVYNRTWKAVLAVGIPLLVGTFVTFGLANVLVGNLNTNTAFLGSIVVGNGINVGLIFFARYLEERRHGKAPQPAMEIAVRETWLATLTAALAAGVAYASLLSTDFRGFNQFGLIGGIGMTLSWITSYLVTPAARPRLGAARAHPARGPAPGAPGVHERRSPGSIERAPRVDHGRRGGAHGAVGPLRGRARGATRRMFEYDFSQAAGRRRRSARAARRGGTGGWTPSSATTSRPTVLLARDEAEAREHRAARSRRTAARGPDGLIGPVVSIAAVVPDGQEEKLPVIREIRALATPENLAFLPPDRRMAVAEGPPARGPRARSAPRTSRRRSAASSPRWTGASARRCSSTPPAG